MNDPTKYNIKYDMKKQIIQNYQNQLDQLKQAVENQEIFNMYLA